MSRGVAILDQCHGPGYNKNYRLLSVIVTLFTLSYRIVSQGPIPNNHRIVSYRLPWNGWIIVSYLIVCLGTDGLSYRIVDPPFTPPPPNFFRKNPPLTPHPPYTPPPTPIPQYPHPPYTPIGPGPGPRAARGGRGGKGASYKQNMGQLYSRPPLPPHAALGPGPGPIGV